MPSDPNMASPTRATSVHSTGPPTGCPPPSPSSPSMDYEDEYASEDEQPRQRIVLGAVRRRTTITGSPVETMSFRRMLFFIPDETFNQVSVTGEERSILVRYSWAIPIPPFGPLPPKEEVLLAFRSPAMRKIYHCSMAGTFPLLAVEKALDRLVEQLANLGVEGARVWELDDLTTVILADTN